MKKTKNIIFLVLLFIILLPCFSLKAQQITFDDCIKAVKKVDPSLSNLQACRQCCGLFSRGNDDVYASCVESKCKQYLFPQEPTTQPKESDEFIIENPLGQDTDIFKLLDRLIDYFIWIIIFLTPIMIVYAGYLYITSAGSPQKIQTAHKVLIWALIGLAVVLIAKGVPALIKEFLMPTPPIPGGGGDLPLEAL